MTSASGDVAGGIARGVDLWNLSGPPCLIDVLSSRARSWVSWTSDSPGIFGPLGYIRFQNGECSLIFVENISAKLVQCIMLHFSVTSAVNFFASSYILICSIFLALLLCTYRGKQWPHRVDMNIPSEKKNSFFVRSVSIRSLIFEWVSD